MTHQARRIVFTAKQKVILEDFGLAAPGAGEVLVEARLSLMSTGTENILFNQLYSPGTHWGDFAVCPMYPGYAMVGIVAAIGAGVAQFAVGARVAVRAPHQSRIVCDAATCYPIPEGIAGEEAVWFALAKIAFSGASAASYRLGDRVLIIGAGPIGQMSVRWARAAGADAVVVADLAPSRLVHAKAGGATTVIEAPIHRAREAVLAAAGGRLPRVVLDTTGHAAVFAPALSLVADHGTLVVLGDTGAPEQQHLTGDVITRGLRIVGAHDRHNTAEWNNATITAFLFRLAGAERFSLAGLNTHRFSPRDCAEAYAVANRERATTMGIVFDWADAATT